MRFIVEIQHLTVSSLFYCARLSVFYRIFVCVDELVVCNIDEVIVCVGHDDDPAEYPVCGKQYQSPVNITVSDTKYDAQYTLFQFLHEMQNVSFKLINKNHTGLVCLYCRVTMITF